MIAKRIEGLFDEASVKTLFNKKREFTWNDPITGIEELDDPTILQITINCTLPNHAYNNPRLLCATLYYTTLL